MPTEEARPAEPVGGPSRWRRGGAVVAGIAFVGGVILFGRSGRPAGQPVAGPATTTAPAPAAGSTTASPFSPGPSQPHGAVCGNQALLAGPVSPPPGAVIVSPGHDLQAATVAAPTGTTFWLAPGTHTLGGDQFDQVVPKDGDTYIGAPGAVLDGRRVNRYAFTQHARNVTVRYLTITRFGPVGTNGNEGAVNHDSGPGWTVAFNTIEANAGAGVMVGDDNTVMSNCLSGNGEYGFSVFSPPGVHNVTITGNEIVGNNTDDWEARVAGCGCTGGGKFWDTTGAVVTSNWVHGNKGVGLFADTDNVGLRIEDNTIEGNDAEGIVYEISYNARIAHNLLAGNAIAKGKQ
ncbi:MAG: hypothetical protein QOK39_78, partial [Acidimicrobiaceae bacterium]|nr:hypothetical protein [Acidimicrobiaceae bacterium]